MFGWLGSRRCIKREERRRREREYEILQRIKKLPQPAQHQIDVSETHYYVRETCGSARPMILNVHSFSRFPATTVALRANTNFIRTHIHTAVCVFFRSFLRPAQDACHPILFQLLLDSH